MKSYTSAYSNSEDNFGSKIIYAEQSYLNKQKEFLENLKDIKNLLRSVSLLPPFCHIVHASPTEENKDTEKWVEPFLNILYDHLKEAGISVSMDTRDVGPGESMYSYIRNYYNSYVILVGTESLLQKSLSHKDYIEKSALVILSRKAEADKITFGNSRICSLLISGSFETSFETTYGDLIDAQELGYIDTIQHLLSILYDKNLVKVKSEYKILDEKLNEFKLGLTKFAPEVNNVIEKQPDILYQHTTNKMAYAEYGKQFQRPSLNDYFIERKNIRKQIITYFQQQTIGNHILYICGLGGLGKTAMAEDYYLYPPQCYTLRAWFNAENKEQLYLQYVELGKTFGVNFVENTSIREQALLIKNWLENNNNNNFLIVYDGVSNITHIEELLPETYHNHIIITTRNSTMRMCQTINIDVMEEHEAVALIGKYVKIDGLLDKVKRLVATFSCVPLALSQAGAYMDERRTSFDDYINIYHSKYESYILNDVNLIAGPKHEPIWITYDKDLEMIKEKCLEAYYTLVRASFMKDYIIPEYLLESFLVDTDDKPKDLLWDDVKGYIRRHSLMRFDIENKRCVINPLLKRIIRRKYRSIGL